MKTLKDVDVKDKVVLVRVDYNVPLETLPDGTVQVASDLRVRASLPTIQYLRENGAAKIILMSHLGRPKNMEADLSLRPVAETLAELLEGVPVEFVDEVTGEEVRAAVAALPRGGVLLLENLRFDKGEKANSLDFARELVADTGAELFVMDGFGVAHRATASTVAIADLLPAVAGLLVEKEVATLGKVLEAPVRPLVVVIGGAKVEDKAPLIQKFLPVADQILVGGKIAADGDVENEKIAVDGAVDGESEKMAANGTAEVARQKLGQIYIAEDFDTDAEGNKLDVGPVAASKMLGAIADAGTVLWSGLLGKAEDPAFATSSEMVAKYLGEHPEINTVICGGDTTGFVAELMEKQPELKYTLLSTGGGAALEFLTAGKLVGLEKL